MFAILLSILFSTNVLAAPTQFNVTVPWSNLKNDKSLYRFQSTLLNQTMLTFLNECYPPKLSSTKEWKPCSRYFDAIRQLNNTDFVVQIPAIDKLLNESSKDTNFCKQNHTFPAIKYYPTNITDEFNDTATCGYLCIQENNGKGLVPKPICVFLAWMGEQIKNFSSNAAIATPPLVPASVLKSDKVANLHAITSNEANIQDLAKPAVVVDEIPDVAKVVKPPIAESNISAQIPANSQSQENQPKEQNSNEPKLNVAAAAVGPAAAVAASESVPAQKEEKQGKQLQLNTEIHEDEQLLKELPTNLGKHDSLSVNQPLNEDQPNENDSEADPNEDINPDENEDEGDDFGLNSQKLKPKDPPLASPDDNEADQRSSQEIIDGNYLPNTNKVPDPFFEESGSNFFTYFLIGMFLCIILYVVYHNKSKILALLLEGRRGDKGRSGRRKHTAAYRKLDSNLEEAITSSASGRTTQIIY